MNDTKPSFYGKCYGCGKKKEIVSCISWGTQNDQNNKKVSGGFRNFCEVCEKSFGIGINRAINIKDISKGTGDLSKYSKCDKCKMYYLKTNDFSNICLVCYGRGKCGSN
jgi:hypothetical protein